MKIKEVMVNALRRVGREDIAADIEKGSSYDTEEAEAIQTMLYCVNATEAELARYYYPLIYTQSFTEQSGCYYFSKFAFTPVKILSVKSGGVDAEYEITANFIKTQCKQVEVKYMYLPAKKDMDGESEFGLFGDGNVTALGAAAEYCLMCGESKMAEVWETRYRAALERALKAERPPVYIPPRRWV